MEEGGWSGDAAQFLLDHHHPHDSFPRITSLSAPRGVRLDGLPAMQGFNMGRYRPYDADPQKESFNARSGTHPLGKRARKIDQGVLIVRFELPFNIWCGGCGGHIGQGVRYNAEKMRVGEYYSTPIFRFRCKTACCQHWFEVETDPRNTRYVVVSGAKEQSKEWDPEENGGFAIQDGACFWEARQSRVHASDETLRCCPPLFLLTDGTGGPSSINGAMPQDSFSALERSVEDKARAETRTSRLLELESAATARSTDPYTLNSKLRSRFRQEKRERVQLEARDEDLRKRIGWNSDRPLVAANTPHGERSSTQAWVEARDQRAGKGHVAEAQRASSSMSTLGSFPQSRQRRPKESRPGPSRQGLRGSLLTSKPAASDLAARIIATSRTKADPFAVKR